MNSVDFADDGDTNEGLVKRRAFVLESRTFDMMGRLHADIFFRSGSLHAERGRRQDKVGAEQRLAKTPFV